MNHTDTPKITALLHKARLLPCHPGVYLFYSEADTLLYVGKSKALKNRVSSYFQSGEKNLKTTRLVSQVDHFETILTDTEQEALLLENELIKRNQPKYNILLKDDKNYPYLYLSLEDDYPRLSLQRSRRPKDRGLYFGPYSSSPTVKNLIQEANRIFLFPRCHKHFPDEIGKARPCLYYDMGRCMGLCTGKISREDYARTIDSLLLFLKHDHRALAKKLEKEMLAASEQQEFEKAAKLRDAAKSLRALDSPQRILASPTLDADVFALHANEALPVIARLCVRQGSLIDVSFFCFGATQIVDADNFSSLLFDYYRHIADLPRKIYLDASLFYEEDALLSAMLSENAGRKIEITSPVRGEGAHLVKLARENAQKECEHRLKAREGDQKVLTELAEALHLPALPHRIEAYDISNSGNDTIYGGMVVLIDGKFRKNLYRSFRIEQEKKDDYAAMEEVLTRRFSHVGESEEWASPDLILLDGGKAHVSVITQQMARIGASTPVFGMVKDEHHKTRTLLCDQGEISLAKNGAAFGFLYRIQEEVHRFSLSLMDASRRKKMTASRLNEIPGIGEAKAKALIKAFRSVRGIGEADEAALRAVPGIGARDARAILAFFSDKTDEKSSR